MVVMASGIARGRVCTTATVESHNMATILQIMGWQRYVALVYCVLLRYWASMLWSIDTHQNKVSTDQYQVTISQAQVFSSLMSIGSRAHVWLTCWKQSRIVRKPINANPGLKVNRIITFLTYKCFCCFVLCIWWLLKLKTGGQTIYKKP